MTEHTTGQMAAPLAEQILELTAHFEKKLKEKDEQIHNLKNTVQAIVQSRDAMLTASGLENHLRTIFDDSGIQVEFEDDEDGDVHIHITNGVGLEGDTIVTAKRTWSVRFSVEASIDVEVEARNNAAAIEAARDECCVSEHNTYYVDGHEAYAESVTVTAEEI